jgi:hypothetical protein
MALEESYELRRGWRVLVLFRADAAAELMQNLVESAFTWHIPSPE